MSRLITPSFVCFPNSSIAHNYVLETKENASFALHAINDYARIGKAHTYQRGCSSKVQSKIPEMFVLHY